MPRFVRSIVSDRSSDIEKAHAIASTIKGLSFNDAWLPPTLDPLKSLTGYGGGYCMHQSYSFQMLASLAGLRVRTCGHSYGTTHVTNEVMINGKWRLFDLSMDVEAETSFDELAKNPAPLEIGDAYGQVRSGTTADRYIRALYSGETKCFEFQIAPGSQYSTQSFDLDKGETVSFDFPRPNPSDANDSEMGEGSFEKSLTVGSSQTATSVSSPWPIRAISVLSSTPLDDYVVEISLDRGATWQRVSPSADDPWRAVVSVDEPESLRGPPLEGTPGLESYGDLQRTLGEGPSFRFAFGNYIYQLRFTPPPTSVRTSLMLTTEFSFNPAAMPQLKPGNNEFVYRDDGVSGRRNVGIEATWIEEPTRPVQPIPPASRVSLSAESATSPPRLISDAEGRLHLTFAVATDRGSRVAYRRFEAGSWSDAQLVSQPAGRRGCLIWPPMAPEAFTSFSSPTAYTPFQSLTRTSTSDSRKSSLTTPTRTKSVGGGSAIHSASSHGRGCWPRAARPQDEVPRSPLSRSARANRSKCRVMNTRTLAIPGLP